MTFDLLNKTRNHDITNCDIKLILNKKIIRYENEEIIGVTVLNVSKK